MGEILRTYMSKSTTGKEYHVIRPNNGGEPYCDCWQWKKTRDCTHLRQYHGKYKEVEVKLDNEIADAIKNIINKS